MAVDPAAPPPAPGSRDDDAIEDIVAEFLLEREDGRDPNVDEWLARFPRHAEVLAKLLSDDTASPATLRRTTSRGRTTRPGAAAPSLPADAVRLVPYVVIEHVSTAGGGTVYRARHAEAGHVVALKVLDTRGAVDVRDVERFRREAAMLRAMNLVNVVPVLDSGDEGGRFWIAMKWLAGSTLAKLREAAREKTHPLRDQRERARLVARIARTFAAIHGYGILHRDVKPTNIMVDEAGEPMIIDFGIAQAPDLPELTATTDQVMGTPRYLAPELLAGGNRVVSQRTDVYGLGLCLYELCTGVEAFKHEMRADLFSAIRTTGPVAPRKANPAISGDLGAVILRALEIDPARRYEDMTAFADDLDRVARGEAPDLATRRGAHPVVRALRRHRRKIVAAACLAAVLIPAAWMLGRRTVHGIAARNAESELRPFAFFVPEAFAGGIGLPPRKEAGALAANPAASAGQRLVAAWLPFLEGEVRHALQNLGARDPADGFATRFFREHLVDLRDAQKEGDRPIVIVVPGTNRPAVNPQTGEAFEAMVPTDNPEGARVRDADAFRESLARVSAEVPPRTPVDHLVRGALAWSQVPTSPEVDSAALRRDVEADADRGLDDPATRAPALHLKGVMRFLASDFAAARGALEGAVAACPSALGARYLLGVATLRAGDPARAVAHLEAVVAALPKGHAVRYRALGSLACARAGAGLLDKAVEACAIWWTESEDGLVWQDAVIPRVLAADFHRRRGDLGSARTLLVTAIVEEERIKTILRERSDAGSHDGPAPLAFWKPAFRDLMEVLDALDDADLIEEYQAKMSASALIPLPPSAEDYLTMNLCGLRAPDPNRMMIPVRRAAPK